MKPLWLAAAVALGVFAMQPQALAGPSVGPPGHIHGIIIRHCHYRYHRCHHHGGVVGVPVPGVPVRGVPIVPPGTGPAHGGIVNGIPPQQQR
jgi:hypothetical protein